MVTEYGMSSLGPIFYNGHDEESIWLAKQIGEYSTISQETASKVDGEISKIIEGAYKKATEILEQNKNLLEKVAARLLEKETLSQEEFRAVLNETQ
jgi:cell division protease FtsH